MIESRELRVGNLLHHTNGNIVEVTTGIIEQFVGNKKFANKVWTPIPLTEEWLVRLGFTPRPDAPWCMERGKIMVNTGNHFIIHVCGKVVSGKHVHQLQNLYFALTGQELTIK